jgi:hypothetical protein
MNIARAAERTGWFGGSGFAFFGFASSTACFRSRQNDVPVNSMPVSVVLPGILGMRLTAAGIIGLKPVFPGLSSHEALPACHLFSDTEAGKNDAQQVI